jgi:cytochrome c-type biogenesis protein CcmE
MKRGPIIAFLVLVAAAVFTFVSFSGATARHVTIRQAKQMRGRIVQVPGKIVKDTVAYTVSGQRGQLRFEVTDMHDPDERMQIVYAGAKPENFANATNVEAIGVYEDGEFRARTLLVKCPSRYQGSDGASQTAKAEPR